jgi:hypothetical protein
MRNRLWLGVLCLVVSACGSSGSAVVVDVDAGADAASDLGADLGPADAGPLDAGTPPEDATPRDAEAPADLGMDAPVGDTGPRACTGNTDCAGHPARPRVRHRLGALRRLHRRRRRAARGGSTATPRPSPACRVAATTRPARGHPPPTAASPPTPLRPRHPRSASSASPTSTARPATLCVGSVCVTGCNLRAPLPRGPVVLRRGLRRPASPTSPTAAPAGQPLPRDNATAACQNGLCAVGPVRRPLRRLRQRLPGNGCEANTLSTRCPLRRLRYGLPRAPQRPAPLRRAAPAASPARGLRRLRRQRGQRLRGRHPHRCHPLRSPARRGATRPTPRPPA